jgi:hypothetical protein
LEAATAAAVENEISLHYKVGKTLSGVSSNDVGKLKTNSSQKETKSSQVTTETNPKTQGIITVHVTKSVRDSSPESIVTIWTRRLELRHPVSIPVGVKYVTRQVQSGGLSSAKVLIPESLCSLAQRMVGSQQGSST